MTYEESLASEFYPHFNDTSAATGVVADLSRDTQYQTLTLEVGSRQIIVKTTADSVDWLRDAIQVLNEYSRLPQNWDGYNAKPISQGTIENALTVYVRLAARWTSAPQIIPTVDGGIGLEWHDPDRGLEIEVIGRLPVHAYYYDNQTDEEWEKEINLELEQLVPYLERVGA